MIIKQLKECIADGKEEFFRDDHHYYLGQEGRDADFMRMFDHKIYVEYVEPVIEAYMPDLYELSDKHALYVKCLELVKGE